MIRRRRRAWLWPAAFAALIFLLSSQPVLPSPDLPWIDKVEHFAAYGLLATLLCRLGRGWRVALWALLATSAYGATDEWHQHFVPGRSCDVFDWIADTLGAASAVVLYGGWHRYRALLERPWRGRATARNADGLDCRQSVR